MQRFLVRVDQEEVHGYCSAFVLNEVFHKLMMSEIMDKFGVQAEAANNLFKQRPEIISELFDVWEEMDIINNINITILNGQIFPEFVDLSRNIVYWLWIPPSCNYEKKRIDKSGN